MQILMIGNGFDIEHKLPTQYKDFFQFTKEFLSIYASEKRNIVSLSGRALVYLKEKLLEDSNLLIKALEIY